MPTLPPPSRFVFDVSRAAPGEDLVGVGADLAPGTLLEAYANGLFPMGLGDGGGPVEREQQRHRVDTLAQVTVVAVQRLRGDVGGEAAPVPRKGEGRDPRAASGPLVDEPGHQGVLACPVQPLDRDQLAHEGSI